MRGWRMAIVALCIAGCATVQTRNSTVTDAAGNETTTLETRVRTLGTAKISEAKPDVLYEMTGDGQWRMSTGSASQQMESEVNTAIKAFADAVTLLIKALGPVAVSPVAGVPVP